ncbi:hypothetical protein K474DRAFT_1609076 [Panus rudis PR-1116 ss-1]|nr:hypothetical protein K474DRAFT_1609076 [Panus rudis PR-1116 ss-1]
MSVVRKTRGGSWILAEMDGSVSWNVFAAFRLVPYFARDAATVPITPIEEVEQLGEEWDNEDQGEKEGEETRAAHSGDSDSDSDADTGNL